MEITQEGGKYLSEGADGCIFQSPDNWPCLKALKGYSPNDKSLVTKIVPDDDIEGNILEAVKSVAKDNPKNYNLIKYIGQCSPKLSGFTKKEKKSYNNHINQIQTTKKACKSLRKTLKNNNGKNQGYKMYILGKYEMNFKEFANHLIETKLSKETIANIIYDVHEGYIDILKALMENKKYTIVNYDLHSKNIGIFKNPKKEFNIKDSSTFQVGPSDFGRALWKKNTNVYNKKIFKTWDKPFIDDFITVETDDIDDTYAIYVQFSLEVRLINYIMYNEKSSSNKLWIERMYSSESVKNRIKKHTTYDMLLFYLPTFIESVKKSEKYRRYENKLEGLAILLKSEIGLSEDKFEILKQSPNMRKFFDEIKKRSHIPTAFGVFVMHSLRACRYTRDQIMELVANPAQTKIDIPDKLRLLIIKYTDLLLEPFN
jgi:hypothetical protein